MPEKRRDAKGRILRDGEVQRKNGQYMFRYTDGAGDRKSVYSWKLVETDKMPDGKKNGESLRSMEKQIEKDLDDKIKTSMSCSLCVNDLYDSFMGLRTDLRESTRCNYRNLYNLHVRDTIGGRIIKTIKFSDVQKLYLSLVKDNKLKLSTVEKIHCILYQMFDIAVLDNILRVNPAANTLKAVRKMIDEEDTRKHALTEEQQKKLIEFVYGTKNFERWRTLFTVLFGTGMRISEALGLRWCDCDFDSNTISVNHTPMYKESEHGGIDTEYLSQRLAPGIRTIPMWMDVGISLIKEMNKRKPKSFTVDGYTDFIFLNKNGRVYTQSAVFDAIQEITSEYNAHEREKARDENTAPCYLPKIRAHILRHTFCTRYGENESNI